MTAIVRHFNGTSSDHLDTLLASGTLDDMSAGGWVKRDALGATIGFIGRAQNANNQWSFYQFTGTDALVFQVTNTGVSKVAFTAAVDTQAAWCWVGFTRKKTTGVVNFYFGTAPGSLTVVPDIGGTGVDIQVPNGSGLGTQLGGVNQGNLIGVGWLLGFMDQWNFWTATLTKAELEASMFCGAVVRPADAIFIVPIIGASPEPTVSLSGVADMTVNGTTVVTGSGIGCESNAPPGIPSGGIGVRPPDFSGGPGGGINNPPSMFDEGSTGGFSGIAGSMEFKPPEYGNTMGHKKYSMGKGLLNQRLAPAFRGLDHLAAYTRRRKK